MTFIVLNNECPDVCKRVPLGHDPDNNPDNDLVRDPDHFAPCRRVID